MISLYKEFLLIYNLGIKQASWGKRMRLIRHIFYNIFLRKNIPTTVVMGLTYRCQCNCSHCSIDKDNKNSMIPEMDTTEVKKCIDEIVDLGSIKVNFFGGEPSMRSDIIELVRYASSKKLFVFLDTNGFLLDESLVVQLKRAGVSCVTVSIDSFKEDEHDLSRGEKGSYKRAIKAVENCLKVKIPCVISTIATNDSISSGKLRRVILEAKMMRVNGVRILLPMLSGKWHNKKEYLLSEESWKKLALFFDPGFVYFENGFLTRHNDKFEIVCPAAIKRLIYISPHGFIHPCYTVPYSFGNVKKTRLKEIVNNMWKHPLMKSPPQNVCLINDESYRRLLMDYKEI